jgi:excinuclease ABC subunit B
MSNFNLSSTYRATGDQPQAIEKLYRGIENHIPEQVLEGVTGSGKTFTMANIIAKTNKPTLIISHNKTLAAQLYQEFRDYFPENAVGYFVSYYDYYQPEAYIPTTDTYIEKETEINEEIDKLRLAATTNILTRKDTIIVASVSCIYNIGSPKEYGHFVLDLSVQAKITREQIFEGLVRLQYERSDYGYHRGSFRVRGEAIDIYPAYENTSIRVLLDGGSIISLDRRDPLTGKKIESMDKTFIYPAKHYMTDPQKYKEVFAQIRGDMEERVTYFTEHKKFIEAQRIREKVTYDLEMIEELGFVNGIENYSRYFDGRAPGDPPFSMFDYFKESYGDDWLLFVDESHMSIPQIRGMYNGDRSRKQTLIDYGFRLPAAIDNRPLRFEEFLRRIPQTIYVSATPADWEISRVGKENVVEQLIRPTGLVDPEVTVRPIDGQIDDLIQEITSRVSRHERVLVTTLTKRTAEDLSSFLKDKGIKVHYLHSEVLTMDRSDILDDLRSGLYDVIVGINLLREGLDLPEVSLVAVLDADKEGFLRSRTSLVQTMGRAARHVHGEVILYADVMTDSMKYAIDEVKRRREKQLAYNAEHSIIPIGISKPIRERMVKKKEADIALEQSVNNADIESMTPVDKKKHIVSLTKLMKQAARDMDFESAAQYRDLINKMNNTV